MNNENSKNRSVISIYIEKVIFQIANFINNNILVGSERQNKAGINGERISESGSINKSLLNLSIIKRKINIIKNIQYRDSKLTHFLRDKLGGNSKTVIIATISPFNSNLSEIKSTLNFTQNDKKIKIHAIINEEMFEN